MAKKKQEDTARLAPAPEEAAGAVPEEHGSTEEKPLNGKADPTEPTTPTGEAAPAPGKDPFAPLGPPPRRAVPPPGTYPDLDAVPVRAQLPGPAPAPPEKRRWVGTFTLAISLIACGSLMLAWVLVPQLDITLAARLSPIVLVALGVEVLVASVRHSGEKIRINVFTAFLCLVLVAGSVVASAVPQLVHRYYESEQVNSRLALELEEASFKTLKHVPGVQYDSVQWYVNVQDGSFSTGMTPMDLQPQQYVQLRVYLRGEYPNAAAFTNACKATLQSLETLVPHIDYASFYNFRDENSYTGEQRYTLRLDSRWQMAASAHDMAQQVTIEHWLPQPGYYISQWEWEDRQVNPGDYATEYTEDGLMDESVADDVSVAFQPDDGADDASAPDADQDVASSQSGPPPGQAASTSQVPLAA